MCKSRIAVLVFAGLSVLLVAAGDGLPPHGRGGGAAPVAIFVSVPLPLSGTADTRLMGSLDKLLADVPAGDSRPIVILEFRPADSSAGVHG